VTWNREEERARGDITFIGMINSGKERLSRRGLFREGFSNWGGALIPGITKKKGGKVRLRGPGERIRRLKD